jgi:hypothetical protein
MKTEEIGLEDICSPSEFEQQYRNLFEGEGKPSLDYLIRTRHLNGLSDCGAVIEPAQRRPLIVPPKFLNWLLSRKKAA